MGDAAELLAVKEAASRCAQADARPQHADSDQASHPFVQRIFRGFPAKPPESIAAALTAPHLGAPVLQRAQRFYGNRVCQPIVQHASVLQRKCTSCENDTKPRGVFQVAPLTSGEALDPGTRKALESHFEADLSEVRVHTDSQAARSARSLDALAYTSGRDVYFAPGITGQE